DGRQRTTFLDDVRVAPDVVHDGEPLEVTDHFCVHGGQLEVDEARTAAIHIEEFWWISGIVAGEYTAMDGQRNDPAAVQFPAHGLIGSDFVICRKSVHEGKG